MAKHIKIVSPFTFPVISFFLELNAVMKFGPGYPHGGLIYRHGVDICTFDECLICANG